MQYTNETKGPVEIVQDAEGLYRWTYELDSRENNSFLKLYLLIFALIILIPGAILFFMIFGRGKGSGAGSFLAIWMAIFAGVELLTYLIYKGIEKANGGVTEIPYAMGEEFIIVHPGNRRTPAAYLRTDFSMVKDIKLDRNNDLILLYETARVTHVYVPRADLRFVLNYLFDRLPQKEKILQRKEEYLENRM